MNPTRRAFLVMLGGAAVGGVTLGTGAFSSVNAERTVSVETASDGNALLGIEPGAGGGEYVTGSDPIAIDITGTSAGAQGVNQDAITAIDQLLEVTNNGTSDVVVGFDNEYAIDEGDYADAPGGWGYAVNDDGDAAIAIWASPLPGNMDKTLSEIRPDLVSTGFTGSTLVDGRIDGEIEDDSERTISPGESLNVGIVIDTRDSTVEDEPLPSELDDVISLYAEATGN
jgi:hypothetical protein